MIENINFWSTQAIDLEKYKVGVEGVRARSSYGFCGCSDCEKLKNLRDEMLIARNGPSFFSVSKKNAGVINKDKMSLVIEKPGIYKLAPLKTQTDGRFTSVYFPSQGKHSLVSIYKAARNANQDLMLIDDEIVAAFEGNISNSYIKSFNNVFVMGELSGDSWNEMKNDILMVIEGTEPEEPKNNDVNFDGIYMIDDRFIPCYRLGQDEYIITSENGDNSRMSCIPGLPTDGEAKSLNYLRQIIENSFVTYKSDPYGNGMFFAPYAYDTETHSIVTGVEITDAVWHLVKKNPKKFPASLVKCVKQNVSPGEMAEAIRSDFAKNGANSFTITEFYPTTTETSWSAYRPGADEKVRAKYPCYMMGVSFDGKPLIGNNGSQGGVVYVRFSEEDNRPRLIWSSWCQRVSSWSKNVVGITDQKYDIWALSDWLSGPFAEKCNLKQKDAPLLFCGNKATNSKKEALDKLRARLNKLG